MRACTTALNKAVRGRLCACSDPKRNALVLLAAKQYRHCSAQFGAKGELGRVAAASSFTAWADALNRANARKIVVCTASKREACDVVGDASPEATLNESYHPLNSPVSES